MALANAGFKVEMLCPAGHPVHETRGVSRIHVYNGLVPLRSLRHAIATAKPDLVVPGDDLATFHLHELYRGPEFATERASNSTSSEQSLIERSLGSPKSFAFVHSRAAFMELAREEGVRVPKTEIIRSEDSVKEALANVGLAAVLKADGTSGGDGVRVVRTVSEGQNAFRKLQASPLVARAFKRAVFDHDQTLIWRSLRRIRPTVNAQAFVAGHEATSTVACWKGTVLASLHFEVLRKGNAAGHATVVRLIEKAEISSAVEKVVRRMGLSGFCGFDFMVEANSGHAYLIEINPRSTQVGHLTLGAGRDLPAALYGAVTENPVRAAATATENDTVALFPHEWARDPQSEFLRTAYHDVPWEAPELVHACIRRSRKQSVWYSRAEADHETAIVPAAKPAKAKESSGVVHLDCGTD